MNFNFSTIFIHILFLISHSVNIYGQEKSSQFSIHKPGLPLIEKFDNIYLYDRPRCFDVSQGENGKMYIVNGTGLLEFDGNHWRLSRLLELNSVRALSIHHDKIYIGAQNELGYFTFDAYGRKSFHSLKNNLDSVYNDFEAISSIEKLDSNIYFLSKKYLFQWNGNAFKVWKPINTYDYLLKSNNRIFIGSKEEGLKILDNNDLIEFPGKKC